MLCVAERPVTCRLRPPGHRRIHSDVDELSWWDGTRVRGREMESARAHIAPDNFLESWLVNGNVSGIEPRNLCPRRYQRT